MKLGMVGLPNVGKSTLFNALTNAGAESANYPFCTIEKNVGFQFGGGSFIEDGGQLTMTGGTMSGQPFHFVNARFYEPIDGIDFNPRKPKSFVGFIDVRTVSGAEIAGVTYRRVTE